MVMSGESLLLWILQQWEMPCIRLEATLRRLTPFVQLILLLIILFKWILTGGGCCH